MKKFSVRIMSILFAILFVCIPAKPAVLAAEGDGTVSGIKEYSKVVSLSESYIVYYDEDLLNSGNKMPVIIWANGTFCPPVSYTALLNALAKAGYIVVASGDMMSGDGKMQIKQLDYIIKENSDPQSRFYNKLDVENVAAAGHSQGGRSTVNAINADPRFKCGISIAGSNTEDERESINLNTPILFFSGQADMVVPAKKWILPTYDVANGPAVYACRKNAIHTTCWVSPDEYVTYIDKWCRAYFTNCNNPTTADKVVAELAADDDWKDVKAKNLSDIFVGSVIPTESDSIFDIAAAFFAAVVSAIVEIKAFLFDVIQLH